MVKNIHIKNQNEVQNKINRLRQEGTSKLHIISDFDRTLTQAFINGEKYPSVISLIRKGGYLTPDYPEKAYALFDKYHPIELDETIPREVKEEKMYEWWSDHIKLISKSGMNKEVVKDILKKYPKILRKGALEFFDLLNQKNIPLLIFSSGVGDLIEEYIKKEGKLTSNIHIISNFFDYDKDGKVLGYKSKIIHAMNKNETAIENKNYLDKIKERRNVILLGDSLGDLDMSAGIKHDTIIKIGFLNENVEEKLAIYEEKFDIVILNDSSMDYVLELLKGINYPL